MKSLKITNRNVIKDCQLHFGTQSPSKILTNVAVNFLNSMVISCVIIFVFSCCQTVTMQLLIDAPNIFAHVAVLLILCFFVLF